MKQLVSTLFTFGPLNNGMTFKMLPRLFTWWQVDVDTAPTSGVWFQLITPDVHQQWHKRSPKVIQIAESMDMFILDTYQQLEPLPSHYTRPRNFLYIIPCDLPQA